MSAANKVTQYFHFRAQLASKSSLWELKVQYVDLVASSGTDLAEIEYNIHKYVLMRMEQKADGK